MGFSSWECPRCGDSIISQHAINEGERELIGWQKYCVALFEDGSVVMGEYDGYCRVETESGAVVSLVEADGKVAVYHRACWEADGRPAYTEPSAPAHDQGYFFDARVCREPKPERE